MCSLIGMRDVCDDVQLACSAGKSLRRTVNPLKPELNPSAQRCLTRFFTGEFAS
jgi:hypothetical protein